MVNQHVCKKGECLEGCIYDANSCAGRI